MFGFWGHGWNVLAFPLCLNKIKCDGDILRCKLFVSVIKYIIKYNKYTQYVIHISKLVCELYCLRRT